MPTSSDASLRLCGTLLGHHDDTLQANPCSSHTCTRTPVLAVQVPILRNRKRFLLLESPFDDFGPTPPPDLDLANPSSFEMQ